MISSREKRIISELIHHNGTFLLIKELADQLGVSSRTIHRELKNVTDTLEKLDFSLIREYKKGVKLKLTTEEVDRLNRFINEHAARDLSEEEKKVALIYHLMLNAEGLKKSALAVELGVSEHKVDELIEQMDSHLATFNLEITKVRSVGIRLVGEDLDKQNFLADMMVNELNTNSIYSVIENNFVFSSLTNNKVLGLLEADNIFKVERLLMDELDVLPYQLTENAYLNLTLHIVLAIERMEHDQNVSIRQSLKDELKDTEEFHVSMALTGKLEDEFSVTLPEEEVYFICMHLRGSRRKFQASQNTDSIEYSTAAFIESVSSRLGYPFHAHPELKEGLMLHIEPTLHRMESGIITVNPLLDSIKENYPELFEAVGEGFRHHFETKRLTDSEIGFLTIHFGGILHDNPRIEVTTVCSSGIGTSRILSNQLKTKFSNLHIRQELSISELADTSIRDNELVLSTVPLDLERYILVSPLLDVNDEKKISEAISKIDAAPLPGGYETRTREIHIDPDQAIQASELFLNRSLISHHEYGDALSSIGHAMRSATALPDDAMEEIAGLLKERFDATGFIMGETGFSYPHIKSPLVERHHLVFIHNTAGIEDRNYRDEPITTHHQILLLVPEDSRITDLISRLSVMFGAHHEEIDPLFEDQSPIEETIRNYISTLYTQKGND